jgi:hypothetical protein
LRVLKLREEGRDDGGGGEGEETERDRVRRERHRQIERREIERQRESTAGEMLAVRCGCRNLAWGSNEEVGDREGVRAG